MIILAETATQLANSWPAVAIALISLIGTWGTLIIKWLTDARKSSDTGKAVNEIKEQVADGGDYETNLREDVAEGLQLMKFAVSHIENLPTTDDIKRLDGRINTLGERLDGRIDAVVERVSAIEKRAG